MYDYFFQLNCRPFDLAPDPKFLFMTGQHSRAAANVRFALLNHDSFVVITGEIGTGKTTVLNAALRALGSQYVTARLVHTTLSDVELLQALLSEFGLANYSTKKVKLLDELRAFFLEQHLAGRHVVIIVDEAQHLDPAALEELRLLSCIDSQDRRIVSIVLMGQPALDDVLDDASLAQLRQRTRLRQRLRPMDEADTVAYIRHRLKVAGGNADAIFAPAWWSRDNVPTSKPSPTWSRNSAGDGQRRRGDGRRIPTSCVRALHAQGPGLFSTCTRTGRCCSGTRSAACRSALAAPRAMGW
jgi:general secretion pathway protein A